VPKGWIAALVPLLALLTACTPSNPGAPRNIEPQTSTPPERTLVVVARVEPTTLGANALGGGNPFGSGRITALFNASLDFRDVRGMPVPQLAEALPVLNTDSWRVFPDGRMETSYRLKPNLTWHDGVPLSGNDFVFAFSLYAEPALRPARPEVISYIEEVVAPDPRSIVIRWRNRYPGAGILEFSGLPPLPRHILEQPYRELDPVSFLNHSFWIREYVGLGAYRVSEFEPGAFIEGIAFDGFVSGKPRIERLRVATIGDANTIVSSMLAGAIHYASDATLGFEDGVTLEQQWQANRAGIVSYAPNLLRQSQVQLQPHLLGNPLQLDARVRKAIAHGMDVDMAFELITGGKGMLAIAPIRPDEDFYPIVEKNVTKYPYEPRRARQLLTEVGLVEGTNGIYGDAAGKPLTIELSYAVQGANQLEHEIFTSSLRGAGIGTTSRPMSAIQVRDTQFVKSFSGLNVTSGGGSFDYYTSSGIPTAQNRYSGSNSGGWLNSEFELLLVAFGTTLEPSERAQQIAAMARIWSDDLPVIPHYFNTTANAWSSNLSGVTERQGTAVQPLDHINMWYWNS
jgi:peptide/nickel transport system substrate-binding protein